MKVLGGNPMLSKDIDMSSSIWAARWDATEIQLNMIKSLLVLVEEHNE